MPFVLRPLGIDFQFPSSAGFVSMRSDDHVVPLMVVLGPIVLMEFVIGSLKTIILHPVLSSCNGASIREFVASVQEQDQMGQSLVGSVHLSLSGMKSGVKFRIGPSGGLWLIAKETLNRMKGIASIVIAHVMPQIIANRPDFHPPLSLFSS